MRSTLALLLLTAMFAGCVSETGDPSAPSDPEDTGDAGDEPMPEFEPAPKGDGLSAQEIQALATAFSDEPLTGGQEPWPNHLVKWVNDDTFVFLHFDSVDPVADAAAGNTPTMNWMGLGVRGVFCAEDQPTPDFTHFHKYSAPTYAEGHGGAGGEEGYWLMHINVREFDSPFGPTGAPGVHEGFGPTEPEPCGADYTPHSHDPPNSDGLDLAERQALAAVVDDEPLRGGQEPWPSHLIKWVNEDVFFLLHFNAEDPATAADATMLWAGIGVRGTFCTSSQPDEDFTHFHRSHSPSYAEGHGGTAHMPGYWLLHAATHDFESPFGQTGGPGVHQQFGPTPPADC